MVKRAASNVAEKRARLSSDDWERAALELIAEKGVRGLAVEPLARRLDITKGSFYWHFKDRDTLLAATLRRWEEHDTRNLNRALGAVEHPGQQLVRFFRRVVEEGLTHEVYRELCAAADDPIVTPVIRRVTERRMAQITAAFSKMRMSPEDAEHRARMAYSAYLGFLQLQRQNQAPEIGSQAFQNYVQHVIRLLIG